MAEKLNFMAFRVNLKNSVFIWSTYLTKLLEEKNKQLKIIMKSIMAAQKCKKYMVSGSIEGFFISCSTKIKNKINFINTLTSSGPYWIKCKNRGFWGVTFVFKWFEMFLQREFSNESLILKVFKTINGNKRFVKQILKSFSDRNIFLESPVFRFINSLLYSLKEKRKFKILICWVLG